MYQDARCCSLVCFGVAVVQRSHAPDFSSVRKIFATSTWQWIHHVEGVLSTALLMWPGNSFPSASLYHTAGWHKDLSKKHTGLFHRL